MAMRLLWFLQKPMHNYSYIKKSRDIRIAGSISSILLLLIFITTIYPIVIHVSSIEATGTASNSYINISQGKSSAGLELLVRSTDGTFATTTESDLAEFGVTTNNSSGYTLTISGNENSSNLTNVTTGTSFTSISNATTAAAFDNSVFNGKWGYKPSKYNSSDNSDFLPAPTTTASTLDTTAIANSNANIYTIALGARADYSTPAGTYTNTFTLSAVGNPVTYTLNFADNTGDNSIANMPETLSSTTMKTSVALPTNIPTRTGYTFAGWCDGTVTDNGTSCDGAIYQPSTDSDIVYYDFIDQTSPTNIATLYATWNLSMSAIQDVNSATCTTTPQQVYDVRDGQIYTIQKLADGNCWMLDNLRLGSTTLVQPLSTSNTNMSPSVSYSPIDGTINSYTEPQINTSYANDTVTSYGSGSGKVGVYYNYCAASAGTYCMAEGRGSGDASYDVCPKGWRMPTGKDSGEYHALYLAYSSNVANFKNALSTPLSGYFANNSDISQDSYGYFWTSTYGGSTLMYDLAVSSSSVYTQDSYYRNRGISVRCILRTAFDRLIDGNLTIQDVGRLSNSEKMALATKMDSRTMYSVSDTRDGQNYRIVRLADGNIWMADNLNLGAVTLTSDLDSSNTNLSTTISAATFNSYKTTAGHSKYTVGEYVPVSGVDSVSDTNKGTIYNYCAASAATICSNNNSNDASYDICPVGWRLPTGNSSGELANLYINAGYNSASKMRSSVANYGAAFARAGSFSSGSVIDGSTYWSSTRANDSTMYTIGIATSYVISNDSSTRYFGNTIRCILDTRPEHKLTINFAGSGVKSVKVCTTAGDCTGSNLKGIISSSGESISELSERTTYYLYPTFASGHELDNWTNVGSDGTLSSTSAFNPTFTMGSGDGAVTLMGKTSCTPISGSLQTFTDNSNYCPSGYLIDSRDNQSYQVGKLADGEWWLLENLRLGAATLVQPLSSSNTNMSNAFSLPASSSSGFKGYDSAKINISYANTAVTSYGSGPGKAGVYYN